MNKLTSAALCLLLSLFIISCQKETSQEQNGPGGNGSSNNNATYYPLTEGTWWKYKDSVTGNITLQTITKKTKTINNIVHTGIIGSINGVQSPDTAWAAAHRPDYFLTAEGVSPNTGAPFDFTFHFLNDTASVGYNWEYDAGHGNGFTAYLKTTIIERGIAKKVAGKNYTNVIHTRLELFYEIFGTVMKFATYHYYIAQGVGIVRIESEISNMGFSFKTSGDLIDYQIK